MASGTAPLRSRAIPRGQPAAVPGMTDVQNWVYYDRQTYAAAGQSQLTFFQTPLGQNGRTLEDTNFQGAGSLPAGMSFVLQEVMCELRPGTTVTPGSFGAEVPPNFTRDMYAFRRAGALEFEYSNKKYIRDSPLMRFPMDTRLDGWAAAADATTAAANLQTLVNYATACGRLWRVNDLQVDPQVNFSFTLNWPSGAVALPSGVDGLAYVYMKGYLARFVQ